MVATVLPDGVVSHHSRLNDEGFLIDMPQVQ